MNSEIKTKLVIIIGPTSSGKTSLSLKLAKKFNGEIISADSRQVYRGMDIGTDKAKGKLKKGMYMVKGIPHHLIDVAEPDDDFTVEHWLKLTKSTIEDIIQKKHVPIIAGGTGLYISSLIYGWNAPSVAPNLTLRKKLEAEIKRYGTERLAKKILKKDPEAAMFLDAKNPRRLIRAWEVMEATGKKFSSLRQKTKNNYDVLIIGLKNVKPELDIKIKSRLKKQFKRGLKKEIDGLIHKYGWISSMNTLGYSQWKPYYKKTLTPEIKQEIFNQIAKDTIRYSKRQMTWFKKMPEIVWLETENKKRLKLQADKYIRKFLQF